MKRKIAISFMSTGIFLIFLALGLFLYNNYENERAKVSSEAIVESIRINISENDTQEPILDPFDEEMKIEEIEGYGYIGYLTVPSLGLDLPVMSEWDFSRLKIAPCRYYGSTKTDNLVIAAHNYKVHFGYLGNLQEGDPVIFTDMDSNPYLYAVNSVDILLPTDVDQVKDSGDDLILYTCNYSGDKRIVVRCNYVEK